MNEQEELLNNLKQLIALDQSAGIEYVLRSEAKSQPTQQQQPQEKPTQTTRSSPTIQPIEVVSPATTSVVDTSDTTTDSLEKITQEIAVCKACRLCDGRRNTVPGEGTPQPTLLFVGEGPGADEDAQGRPFVGAAGQLLDKMIIAMGLTRDEVYIANIIKCRPPGNRTPELDEVTACLPFLQRQIAQLKPTVICALGNTPLRALTGNDKAGITRMRGKQLSYNGIVMIPTFHPSFLLRNPDAKKPCWDDLQAVLKLMGREPPKRG